MSREVNTIGMTIAQSLESNGMPGATHMGTGFDAWYPGYIDYLPMLQNIAAFWTETALYSYATPHFYTLSDFPREDRELRPQSLYPSPWAGGWWRIKDAIDYMETASLAVLDYAVKYKEALLYNRYQAGRNAIQRYRKDPPYAYIIPRSQRDPVAAAELIKRLAFNGIRISVLRRDAVVEGAGYPRDTWVIPMDQEFAELVRQLFDRQAYPDLREFPDGPPEQPYDAAGWTLPYQMDLRVIEVRTPLSPDFRSALGSVVGKPADRSAADAPFTTDSVAAGIAPLPGKISGAGDRLAVDPAQNNAFRLLNRALGWGRTDVYRDCHGHHRAAHGSCLAVAIPQPAGLPGVSRVAPERPPDLSGEIGRTAAGLRSFRIGAEPALGDDLRRRELRRLAGESIEADQNRGELRGHGRRLRLRVL